MRRPAILRTTSQQVLVFALVGALLTIGPAHAQVVDPNQRILAFEATPLGALPPIALPMPASRNHNYWGLRLQAGQRRSRAGPDLFAVAGGIDLQWRGGSIFGITGGYQARRCEPDLDCGGHALFGARARFNFLTAGPTIAAVIGDYSATTTLGAEVGLGYAYEVTPGLPACTADLGAPLSFAMLQRVRLVAYVTPGAVLDLGCWQRATTGLNFFTGAGMGIQQLGHRGLDVYLGLQKIFRSGAGAHFGISITYVRLP